MRQASRDLGPVELRQNSPQKPSPKHGPAPALNILFTFHLCKAIKLLHPSFSLYHLPLTLTSETTASRDYYLQLTPPSSLLFWLTFLPSHSTLNFQDLDPSRIQILHSEHKMSDADSPPARPDDDEVEDVHEDEDGHDSDKDSDILSEVDEEQFDDQPVEIDSNVASTLKAAKRKKVDGDSGPKKVKESRRPKKRSRDNDDDDADVGDGEAAGERRQRKPRNAGAARAQASTAEEEPEEDEENLTPEERRRRAIDRAMDAAIRNPVKRRRKKDEIVRDKR